MSAARRPECGNCGGAHEANACVSLVALRRAVRDLACSTLDAEVIAFLRDYLCDDQQHPASLERARRILTALEAK